VEVGEGWEEVMVEVVMGAVVAMGEVVKEVVVGVVRVDPVVVGLGVVEDCKCTVRQSNNVLAGVSDECTST
jgi:hypothetical protein